MSVKIDTDYAPKGTDYMAFHIVLVEPEIPPNTGNIARTCAATGSILHLVKPLGFNIDAKSVRRAGLDYWKHLDLRIYDNLDAFMTQNMDKTMYLVTTLGERIYADVAYEDDTMLLFGRETLGLPRDLIKANNDKTIRIPMGDNEELRSLNLSNSVSIVLYEALRQNGFNFLV
jgi:tRNA (cytidine/uridine-2'-O-)-methyltransferase